MGTWGSGNFENDSVIDYLSEEEYRIVGVIAETFNCEEALEPDEYSGEVLFCRIEQLIWILEREGQPPELATVQIIAKWKDLSSCVGKMY